MNDYDNERLECSLRDAETLRDELSSAHLRIRELEQELRDLRARLQQQTTTLASLRTLAARDLAALMTLSDQVQRVAERFERMPAR